MNDVPKWHSYYEKAYDATDHIETQLYEEFPEIRAAAESPDPPAVLLRCPRGHRMITVQLHADHNWRLTLAAVHADRFEAGRRVASASDPLHGQEQLDFDDVGRTKVTFTCPRARCTYRGEHRQDRLLKLYAMALRLEVTEIRLPS